MQQYDLVVVGSGAGLLVLEAALQQGLRCAIVEKSKFGGTCLTKGCIPSKMLVYPADYIRETENAMRFGVHVQSPEIDWDTIAHRMWEQIDFHKQLQENLMKMPNLTVYQGTGTFTDKHGMTIHYKDGRADDKLYSDRFIIAAGARSFVPDINGLESTGYITSETFFGHKFPDKPWDSLVIVGGGAISVEFAHIFSAFGTKVTIIERSKRIMGKEEEEVADFVAKQFKKNGVDILTDSFVVDVKPEQGKKHLTVENRLDKSRMTILCDELLIASGVRSNADTLSPEHAGIELDEQGWIVTNSYLETSQPHIWALGDINGKYQFRHKANYEAGILARNLFGSEEKKPASYNAVPWAIFTHPQVAHVGSTEHELREKGVSYRSAKNYYSEVVGGRAMGYHPQDDDNGFVKVLVGENKQILGVHIVGPQAAVLLQPFVYLIQMEDQCDRKLRKSAAGVEIEGLRLICPQLGSYVPIMDSMVIHPSLNELTAWVFEKLE